MAMIKCPKCGGDISDKSEKCVHCGESLLKEERKCEECGEKLKSKDKVCPKCGCPVSKEKGQKPQQVELTKVNIKPSVSKKKLIIIIAIIVGLIATGIGTKVILDKREENRLLMESNTYESNLRMIVLDMLMGAADAEECGNLIKKVWYNSIYETIDSETDNYTRKNYGTGAFYDDFNDALGNLFSDEDFNNKIEKIKENQSSVAKQMKEMKNPPAEWEDAYQDLRDYYDNYLTFTNLVINPSGSLTTFSTNFNNADSEALNGYNKLNTYLGN